MRGGMLGLELEHRHRTLAKLLEAPLYRLEEILGVGLIEREVRVAHHAEEMRAFHRAAEKQRVDVGADDVFEHDERLAVR